MRVSCNWLSRHVDLSGVDLSELGRRFTMSVAELDGIERVGHDLDKVVVGHVLDVANLEGKKVRLTTVDCGPEHGTRKIICGAPNVAAGMFVPVALPGQRLGDLVIEVAAVAGVESFGMICSERELGFSDEHAGIMSLDNRDNRLRPGMPLVEAHPEIADTIFVIDNKSLTHRPDCWGHRGIAREVAALLNRPLKEARYDVAFTDAHPIQIAVEDLASCPRYTATTMANVFVAPSPLWLRLLLSRAGMRPINNLVDATNFAMLDLGNPLHAFDARQVGSRIVVRRADNGERFTTLDGGERTLNNADLLICEGEGKGRPVALAGVMGGLDSEIKDDTTALVLEAANFDPARVRTTAQRLGLRTESSSRFEKSLDPRLVPDAAACFLSLVRELCPGATVTSAFMDVHAPLPATVTIATSVAYIEERLGHALGADRVVEILRGLAFGVELHDGAGHPLTVTVPSWRATKDIGIADDLVEEVGRVFGYDNIPPQAPLVPVARPEKNAKKKLEHLVRNHLALALALDELQTYSFDDDAFLSRMGVTPGDRVHLVNAISSDEPCMRRDLAPHLIKALDKNARSHPDVGLFELGRVFRPRPPELPEQPTMLGVLVATKQDPTPDWAGFHWAKAIVQSLAKAIERPTPELVPGVVTHGWAHPVRQAALRLGDTMLGYVAELHPAVLHKLSLDHKGFVFEIDLDAWRGAEKHATSYKPLPRFPAVFRDFAVVVPQSVPAETLRRAIAAASPLVAEVAFESVYSGPGVDDGMKSVAWSVTFRHAQRTLNDAEVREAEAAIWSALTAVGGKARA